MYHERFVAFEPSPGSMSLTDATILIDGAEAPGVHIAARNLVDDFARVTQGGSNSDPSPLPTIQTIDDYSKPSSYPKLAIVVGTLPTSSLLRAIEEEETSSSSSQATTTTTLSSIRGKWECFTTFLLPNPASLPGCDLALIIAGSDKRGAIYGTYTLSEQIGVSPWYWWADVPPHHHPRGTIHAIPGVHTVSAEPSVRYRGIFINDEAPALTGWVREKFGGYGPRFYAKVFELLLRLRANFLWPAMWPGFPNPGAVFFLDGKDDGGEEEEENTAANQNQILAEDYGVVISTSHHEPMQRATTEWFLDPENGEGSWDWLENKEKITRFFEEGARRAKGCESYFTLGMRGEYDKKMKTDDPAAVVRDVIRTQRSIVRDVYGREDGVCQLLALYKEVLDQFESGRLEVPEDVTLLFSDDNQGTIRRLPTGAEADRKGGAGIYYHLEYVGTPRSYKWINSNSLGKMWHQLREAYRRRARQIWVFNVGDIKPLEVPLTFAMEMAWNVDSIKADGFADFYHRMAQREFGGPVALSLPLQKSTDMKDSRGELHAPPTKQIPPIMIDEIASLWHEYDRLASLRKHEMIEPETFSVLQFGEFETILQRWQSALNRADQLLLNLKPPTGSLSSSSIKITTAKNYNDQKEPLSLVERKINSFPHHASLFQLVHHPLHASTTYLALRHAQALNRHHALQRRNTTNILATRALSLFDRDFDIQQSYHSLLDGKWNHMMRQPHYGYSSQTWHAPSRDMISGLCFIQRRQDSSPIVGQMGVAVQGNIGVRPGLINEESERTHPSRRDLVPGLSFGRVTRYDADGNGDGVTERHFEVFSRGSIDIHWRAEVLGGKSSTNSSNATDDEKKWDWIRLDRNEGTLRPDDEEDARVKIRLHWDEAPEGLFLSAMGEDVGDFEVLIQVSSVEGDLEHLHLPLNGRWVPGDAGKRGRFGEGKGGGIFVESGTGYVSIPAPSALEASLGDPYELLPNLGRELTGAVGFSGWSNVDDQILWLSYPIYTFTESGKTILHLIFTTTLDVDPANPMTYDLQIDDQPSQTSLPLIHRRPPPEGANVNDASSAVPADGWAEAAMDGVWFRKHELELSSGLHVLKVKLRHTNMVLEKLVLDIGKGGAKMEETYLGPPPSYYLEVP